MSDTESSELEQLKKNHQSIRMMINEIYKAINDGINGYLLNNRYYELEKKIIDYLLEYQSVKTKYEGHNKSIFDVERYRLYNDSESKHKMAKIKEVMNEIKAKLKGIKVENFKVQKPLVAEITFFVIDNPRREKIAFGMNAIRKLKIVIITTGSNNWIVVSQDTHSKMRNDS